MTTSKQDNPEYPSVMDKFTESFHRTWFQCVEQFCRSIGINESNAREVELQSYEPLQGFVVWNGVRVGEINTEVKTENGIVFTVTCRKVENGTNVEMV